VRSPRASARLGEFLPVRAALGTEVPSPRHVHAKLQAAARALWPIDALGGPVRSFVSESQDLKSRPAGGTYLLSLTQNFVQSPLGWVNGWAFGPHSGRQEISSLPRR
jgi:hypothetical protein